MFFLRFLFILIIISYTVTVGDTHNTQRYSELSALKKKIYSNYYTFDTEQLLPLLRKADSINNETRDWHAYYYSGMLNIILGKIYYTKDENKAYDYFDEAIEKLKKANEIHESSEILTLLSCAYGKKASLTGISAFFLGLKAKEKIEDAYENDKNNPKIYLIAATHLMHLPKALGGSKQKAENYLSKALRLNNKYSENDKLILKWAEDAEIYAYLAQLEILKENTAGAETYMQKALELVPDYGYVLYDLTPQLKELKR